MTEAEWLTTDMPLYMLREYPTRWDERKAFLAASHCLRHSWHLLTDLQRHYVEVMERFAEGLAKGEGSVEELNQVWDEIYRVEIHRDWPDMAAFYSYHAVKAFSPHPSQGLLIDLFSAIAHSAGYAASEGSEKVWQCRLLRDLFGNPFRPVAFSPAWRTDTALALARQMYESRDFGAMPILADALQDAGCDNDDILGHCRGPGPHVRGCWVVDLVLGKE